MICLWGRFTHFRHLRTNIGYLLRRSLRPKFPRLLIQRHRRCCACRCSLETLILRRRSDCSGAICCPKKYFFSSSRRSGCSRVTCSSDWIFRNSQVCCPSCCSLLLAFHSVFARSLFRFLWCASSFKAYFRARATVSGKAAYRLV